MRRSKLSRTGHTPRYSKVLNVAEKNGGKYTEDATENLTRRSFEKALVLKAWTLPLLSGSESGFFSQSLSEGQKNYSSLSFIFIECSRTGLSSPCSVASNHTLQKLLAVVLCQLKQHRSLLVPP